jgi:hypothetical protein
MQLPIRAFLFGWVGFLISHAGVAPALAQDSSEEPQVDKSGYSLFNPVPDDKLREFSTDRPGKSHSSTTVDAGRFQIESDFLNYTFDPRRPGLTTTESFSVGNPIVKVGVTNWMDFEVGLAFFNWLRQSVGNGPAGGGVGSSNGAPTQAGGSGVGIPNLPTMARGFGDTLLGAKINMFGNDGGDQSLAFLPFVKVPTAARGLGNDHVEFTLNTPYTIALSKPWLLTIEPNFGVVRNIENTRYRENYGFIANMNRPILIERKEKTRLSFDPSLQYLITKTLQIDIGAYLGLNNATPRYNPYIGISARF